MHIDAMIAEGDRISRPSILLSAVGVGEIGAYWGGERIDDPNTVPPEATALQSIRHIITVDARLLNMVGIPANSPSVALYEVTPKSGDVGYRVMFRGGLDFSEIRCSGIPLYARQSRSFPPFEAVCLYGGEVVSSWLKTRGLKRWQYFDAGVAPEAKQYSDEYLRRSPIYTGGADVVLGGWHQMWPEDDFYFPLEMRLALLTLRDAEPWLALWHSLGHGNWSVRSHVT